MQAVSIRNGITLGWVLLFLFSIGICSKSYANKNQAYQQAVQSCMQDNSNVEIDIVLAKYQNASLEFGQFAYRNAFVFNPRKLRWYAYDGNGKLIKSGHAVGGASYCPDIKRSCRTPSGTYRIISKGGPDCRSSRYPLPNGGAVMSYCMFFSKNYAIHASNDLPKHNASHGCIRVSHPAARWLSRHFIRIGTTVVVLPY